jgi:septal ring factor EnvC (AmiA/AmiB activator)
MEKCPNCGGILDTTMTCRNPECQLLDNCHISIIQTSEPLDVYIAKIMELDTRLKHAETNLANHEQDIGKINDRLNTSEINIQAHDLDIEDINDNLKKLEESKLLNEHIKNRIVSIIAKLDNGTHSANQLQGIDEALIELFNSYRILINNTI